MRKKTEKKIKSIVLDELLQRGLIKKRIVFCSKCACFDRNQEDKLESKCWHKNNLRRDWCDEESVPWGIPHCKNEFNDCIDFISVESVKNNG